MRERLNFGDKLLLAISILILVLVAACCAGAEWCRHNYYCGDTTSQQYANDCAAHGLAIFFRNTWCLFDALRDDINALATSILAVFTIILAYAARRQAILTRDAVNVASEQARHMESSVKAAQFSADNAFAVETARLFIDDIDVTLSSIPNTPIIRGPIKTDNVFIDVKITVRNLGRTPAILSATAGEVKIGPDLPDKPDFRRSWHDLDYGAIVIAPNETSPISTPPTAIMRPDWDNIQNNCMHLWLYGAVRYWDILHCENSFYFCAEWVPTRPPFNTGPSGRFIHVEKKHYSYYYRNPYPGEATRMAPIYTALPRDQKTE